MFKASKLIAMLGIVGMLMVGCGKNPFGPGAAGGLDLFAKIGKAMAKPSAINEEENSEDNAKSQLATGAAKRFLAKGSMSETETPLHVIPFSDGWLYAAQFTDHPDENDPAKLSTGKAEIFFKYNGDPRVNFNEANVTDLVSWHFTGRQTKTWSGEIDSLEILVTFKSTSLTNIKPGFTAARGWNITPNSDKYGDSAYFAIETLDEVTHTQSGGGNFYDAKDDNGESHTFSFDLQIIHKNKLDASQPYLRYEDNEGILTFTLPWGETGKNLFFHIHFYPPDQDGELGYRVINIYEDSISGDRLYYLKANNHGEEIESINFTES